MFQLFKGASPFAYLVIFLICFGLRLPEMLDITTIPIIENDTSFGWVAIQHFFNLPEISLFWKVILDAFICFISGLLVNAFLVRSEMFPRIQVMFPGTFVLLSGLYPFWNSNPMTTIGMFFFILSFVFLMDLMEENSGREKIFFTGFFWIISILFLNFLGGLFIVYFYGIFLRSYKIKDFLLFLIGCFLPLYFLGILFYQQNRLLLFIDQLNSLVSVPILNLGPSWLITSGLAVVAILLIYGLLYLISISMDYRVIKLRRQFNLLILGLFNLFIFLLFTQENFYLFFKLMMFPITVFIAKLLLRDNPRKLELYLIYSIILFGIGYRFKEYVSLPF